jgi:hypothetical protein
MPQQTRVNQQTTLQDRISECAVGIREQSATMPPGRDQDELLKKLKQAETAMHLQVGKLARPAVGEVMPARGSTASDPTTRDLDAKADDALLMAQSMPRGKEKSEALKRAGLLRRAADANGISFAKRGRPRNRGG